MAETQDVPPGQGIFFRLSPRSNRDGLVARFQAEELERGVFFVFCLCEVLKGSSDCDYSTAYHRQCIWHND